LVESIRPCQDDFTKVEVSVLEGPKPTLRKLENKQQERDFIVGRIRDLRRDFPSDSICVLHRTHMGLTGLERVLKGEGIECEMNGHGKDKVNYASTGVKLSTMHTIKGLEFDHVIIAELTDYHLPLPIRGSDPDDDLHITTERRLLYTCMTRAKKTLSMTYTGEASCFIKEIDPSLLSDC